MPPAVRSREDRVPEAAALSAVGGFLDAYTFLLHGGVFANAQTGNVVLFGVGAAQGHWDAAVRHVPPVLAFLVGIAAVEILARLRHVRFLGRPTRIVIGAECLVFLLVGLVALPDTLATLLIAFVATMQVGTFRQTAGVNYNTTFTTGNLRSLVVAIAGWLSDHDAASARNMRALLAITVSFAVGAVLGGLAVRWAHLHAVLLVIPVLLAVLASLVRGTRRLAGAGSGELIDP